MSGNRDLRQWAAWRDDYRCMRPAVTCQKCDTHYPRGKDEGNAIYIGFRLVQCGNCQEVVFHEEEQRKAEPRILFPHAYKRTYRDVACRYIQRFGGSTFSVQTDADDCDIYLRNKHGETIASVSLLNRFPETIDESIFSEMPF